MNKHELKKRIAVANKEIPADVVIKNGRIVDVFNNEISKADIAITDGTIVGIGEFEGKDILDAEDRYVSPSFIDGHVHIESSMLIPSEFAKVTVPHGVTTVITDPHEIANVSGKKGIEFMLANSEGISQEILFMLPSCVPATPFENNGATLTAEDLKPYFQHPKVLGLAEVMDYPSLRYGDNSMVDKIAANTGGYTDGHLAGLNAHAVNVYRAAGIKTDHECTTAEEAKERLRRGMYVMIREGSAARDLQSLISIVTPHNARRCLFCTDDKHIDTLVKEGSIDHNVRKAIKLGLDPITALQMATLNAAECYGLTRKGAVAPGFDADLLLLDDLDSLKISEVYKGGKLVAKEGIYLGDEAVANKHFSQLTGSVNIQKLTEKDIKIPLTQSQAKVMEIVPNSIRTNKLMADVDMVNGCFIPSTDKDFLKIAVVERHKSTGNIGLGIIRGLGLTAGAIATTIAHDSHNIVAAGTNDRDILQAIQELKHIQGGLAVVVNGKVAASIPLQVGGLMSSQPYDVVYKQVHQLHEVMAGLGFKGDFDPFLTLAFMTLPVIPSLKLTDLGLFDVDKGSHIDIHD